MTSAGSHNDAIKKIQKGSFRFARCFSRVFLQPPIIFQSAPSGVVVIVDVIATGLSGY